MGKRKRDKGKGIPRAQKTTNILPTKTKQKSSGPMRHFWKPYLYKNLRKFSPYEDTEDAVTKVFTFCSNFADKLEYDYEHTLSGRIDSLIRNFTLNGMPASKSVERNILDKIIKLSREEIREVSSVLTQIHKILDKDCSEVISAVAEEESVLRPHVTLFHPLLLELSSLLPVWIGNINETAPPMVGAIPVKDDSMVEPGQYVAAFVLPVPKDNILYEELGIVGSWILARVLQNEEKKKQSKKQEKNNNQKKTYKIVNLDNVDEPHYTVERKSLIPLPLYRADPRTNPEAIFPIGAVVLALYWNDTCFYPAFVLDTPKTLSDSYTVCFRDLSHKLHFGPTFKVQQRYVIKYVEPFSIFTENERKAICKEV